MERKNAEIVIIEDEEDILELLEYHLGKEGYDVTGFLSADNVERFMEEESPALLIVDRNLPGVEGSEFVASMREIGYDTPVIFLTAKDKESELEEGFKRGGDDYITKPFNTKELLLRVEALLRRSGVKQSDKLRYRDLILDNQSRELYIDKRKIDLTNLEYRLLYTFVKNAQQTLQRDFLRDEVWGDDSDHFHDKTINVAINRLKKKIDPFGEKGYFVPIWGVGYKLG
ncbi:response regulator transcription factor [Sulfurovum sp.]|uniref:response regulator transcription factor n=1 Tax=Sulfurovum sp. TaxID=1969726 RepID=UPI002A3652D3|nr:response regulator transcription factor [Sulfurovum sp.]MDD2451444.1 response regulator transcription factor [Sulfurovum sp.]MDD3499930.1 response regulator transcription factor [Sulfurovum sp.]MDY0403244.1 response regulator transcription factor [Sulfurovum sp.]